MAFIGTIARVALACLASVAAHAGTFHTETLAKGDAPSSLDRTYQVYVPAGIANDGSAPLVTVLHGCKQTEGDMIRDTGFTDLADRNGFVLAFPFVTSVDPLEPGDTNCWRFWYPNERTQGSGEVGDIRRIIARVEETYHTDPDRRYVAGLSSGAAMAVDVAVAYSEDIAAAGSVAGLPYAEGFGAATLNGCLDRPVTNDLGRAVSAMAEEQAKPGERRLVPLMVIQSTNDCKVSIENGANLRDSWIRYYRANPNPVWEADCTTDAVWCRHARFTTNDGRPVVETLFYLGAEGDNTHYWPGDKAGPYANPAGPSASTALWNFFSDKTLAPDPELDITVTEATITGGTLILRGTARSSEPIATLAVRLDGNWPYPPQPLTFDANGGWQATISGPRDDTFYTPVLTATFADGRSVTRYAGRIASGRPRVLVDVVADALHHGRAGRMRAVQPPGCANRGPGVCDETALSLGLRHGALMPFELYTADGGANWFADPRTAMPD